MKEKLRKALRQNDVNLDSVAELIGRSRDYVSRGFNKGTLKVHEACKIADAVGIDSDEFRDCFGGGV